MRCYDDPVEVRRGAGADPDEFWWRGRAWQVREVVSHWVETGAWWARPAAGAASERSAGAPGSTGSAGLLDGDLLRERECWRVTAARDRTEGFGVFDLVFSWTDGGWRLARAVD